MGPKPTPAWGHLLLGIEARTPSFEPNSTKQSETQKKIAGVDNSTISTSTVIRGLRLVSEGTNRCRQHRRNGRLQKRDPKLKLMEEVSSAEHRVTSSRQTNWASSGSASSDSAGLFTAPGGLGDGLETEFRDCEKGASLQNEFCCYWLTSGSSSRDRNSTDLTPAAPEDRGVATPAPETKKGASEDRLHSPLDVPGR